MIFQSLILAISLLFSNHTIETNPVHWTYELVDQGDGMYEFVATAKIDAGWVLYSQFNGEDGPVPTSFEFVTDAKLVNAVEERGDLIKEMDPLFEMEISKFKKEVKFVQKLQSEGKPTLSGTVTWMTCDGLRCLPPTTKEFKL